MELLHDRLRETRRFGDFYFIRGIYQNRFWPELRLAMGGQRSYLVCFLIFCMSIFGFLVECLAQSLRIILRVKQGQGAFGFLIWVSSCLMLLFFSHEHSLKAVLNWLWAIVVSFLAIISSYQVNWNELGDLLWQPQSGYLAFHFKVLFCLGLFQLIVMKFSKRYRNSLNPLKKGIPIVYILLSPYVELPQSYYEVFFEPALTILIAFLFWFLLNDRLYGLYLALSSLCLFGQEIRDYAAKKIYAK